MSNKHPLCPECIYHRGHEDVCEQCEDASEYEPADEGRRRPMKRGNAAEVFKTISMGRSKVDLVDTRDRQSGMKSRAIEIIASYDEVLKRMSDK